MGARGDVLVCDDGGARRRLHLEVVLHGGKRDVGAGSAEDAGQDDRLHLLRAHGDGHENLDSTIETAAISDAVKEEREARSGGHTFFVVEGGDETAAEREGAARAMERNGGALRVGRRGMAMAGSGDADRSSIGIWRCRMTAGCREKGATVLKRIIRQYKIGK